MGDLCEVPFFLFLWTMRIACHSRQVGRGLGAWATTAGSTNADVDAWYMALKIMLGICMGASLNVLFHNCCAVFQASVDRQSTTQRSIEKNGDSTDSTDIIFFVCEVVFCWCSLLFAFGACRLA